jgi:hypothetical protein
VDVVAAVSAVVASVVAAASAAVEDFVQALPYQGTAWEYLVVASAWVKDQVESLHAAGPVLGVLLWGKTVAFAYSEEILEALDDQQGQDASFGTEPFAAVAGSAEVDSVAVSAVASACSTACVA